jgi:hypothetical protein
MTDLFSPSQWPDKWLRYETLNEKARFRVRPEDRISDRYSLADCWIARQIPESIRGYGASYWECCVKSGILIGAANAAGRTGVGSTRYPALTPRTTERLQ